MADMMQVTRREAMLTTSAATIMALAPAASSAQTDSDDDCILWYTGPASQWVEALPIGNGRLGAMVFGDIARERIQLNEDTLWSGGPYAPANPHALGALPRVRELIFAGQYDAANDLARDRVMADPPRQTAYLALGDLFLDMVGFDPFAATNYRRQLDIDAAMASVTFASGGVTYRREIVASPQEQVIAIRLSANRRGAIGFNLTVASPQGNSAVTSEGEDVLVLHGRNNPDNGVPGALSFEARFRVMAQGGTTRAASDHLQVRGADEVTILIAMATSFVAFNDVSGDPTAITRRQIAAASAHSFTRIAQDTAASHRAIFRRVSIDLGTSDQARKPTNERIAQSVTSNDPALAALYFRYARYLLIASSRPGSQPANLQGIWNESIQPPWGSKYTVNINTQMNYWPAEPANMPELVEPLIAMVRDLAVTGARTARVMYGARGWVCHHNTDLWRATAPIDAPEYGLWPTGGAWLCLHLWDHYDYGRDEAYLARIYPILRGAVLFFQDTLVHDPRSGWMVTNPSMSPENAHGHGNTALCAGPTMDNQILRDLFANTIRAAEILHRDADLRAPWQALQARLAPTQIGAGGQIREWQEDWDMGAPDRHHRHVSHLYGLFPSHQISPGTTPDLAAAARRTLEMRGDKTTGWATAWRINLWARLRDGARAHDLLRDLLAPERTYRNMFDAHPPFQIDGNFGGASGIVEMVMQSTGDDILLLPALPAQWPTGRLTGLRARGACTIDVQWRGGALAQMRLTSRMGGVRTILCGQARRVLHLKPGQSVTLTGPELAVT